MNNEEPGKSVPKPIDVPPPTEEDLEQRKLRPPSHNVGVGAALVKLYRNLISDLTNGHWFSNVTLNKLMNDYLEKQARSNSKFNRANDRGNLMKVIVAKAITFKSFLQLLQFAKFTNVVISVHGEREDGSTAQASVKIVLTNEVRGDGGEKEDDK